MRSYPQIRIYVGGDVVASVVAIGQSEARAFADEVARELGAFIGIARENARSLIAYSVGDEMMTANPDCFELSAAVRLLLARDVAAKVRAFLVGGIGCADPSRAAIANVLANEES